jgi:hypothetical protein
MWFVNVATTTLASMVSIILQFFDSFPQRPVFYAGAGKGSS